MHYRSGTGAGQSLRVHSPGGSSFLREMTSFVKLLRQIENPTPSMDVYLVKEHSCQIPS